MKTSLEYKAKEEGKKYILNLENSLIINKEEIKKIEEWINSNGKKKKNYYIDYLEMEIKFLNFINYAIIKEKH